MRLKFWAAGDRRFWSLLLWINLLAIFAAALAFSAHFNGGMAWH